MWWAQPWKQGRSVPASSHFGALLTWQWMSAGKPGHCRSPACVLPMFSVFISFQTFFNCINHPCGALKSAKAHCAQCRYLIAWAVVASLQTPPLVLWCSWFPHSAQIESKTLGICVCKHLWWRAMYPPSHSQGKKGGLSCTSTFLYHVLFCLTLNFSILI